MDKYIDDMDKQIKSIKEIAKDMGEMLNIIETIPEKIPDIKDLIERNCLLIKSKIEPKEKSFSFTLPDFPEISFLPKWVKDGVRDCYLNNPTITPKYVMALKLFSAGPDFYNEFYYPTFHFIQIEKVNLAFFADLCIKHGLALSEKKTSLLQEKIDFLGMKIDGKGIELQSHILEKITAFPNKLVDKKQVQSFLGIIPTLPKIEEIDSRPLSLDLQDKPLLFTNQITPRLSFTNKGVVSHPLARLTNSSRFYNIIDAKEDNIRNYKIKGESD